MAEPTLTEVFGLNAVQDATTLTITKADLTGLTASGSNTAESLLVAIILKAQEHLTTALFDSDTDVSISVENGFSSFSDRNEVSYRVDQRTINMAKLDTLATIDPDDY